jgi:hypothetical protein
MNALKKQVDLKKFSLQELSELIKEPQMGQIATAEIQRRKSILKEKISKEVPQIIQKYYLSYDKRLSILAEKISYNEGRIALKDKEEIKVCINSMKSFNLQYPVLNDYFFDGNDEGSPFNLFIWHYM